MIGFNEALYFGQELDYVRELFSSPKIHAAGNGKFTKSCEEFLEKKYGFKKVLLTNSCTSALEICALLLRKKIGEKKQAEIIMPSYTFVSTANSFAKFGFKIKFVDINPHSMNLDEDLAEAAITKNTVAIVAVNYGGISADLEKLQKICKKNKIFLIEDAAQSIDSSFNKKPLGSFGDLAAMSFHETKNITSGGEGGCLIINNKKFIVDAHIIREKGTNRQKFSLGLVDKYSWMGIGGHYLMPDMNAAFLLYQISRSDEVKTKRVAMWNEYKKLLANLEEQGLIQTQTIPKKSDHNGHMFWIKLKNRKQRDELIKFMGQQNINAPFHYVALHNSKAGKQCGEFFAKDNYTTKESERLVRLPMFYNLAKLDQKKITNSCQKFFK